MKSIKDTLLYDQVIHELQLDFGDFYFFDTYLVGEIHSDVEVSWKHHFKETVKIIFDFYQNLNGSGKELVYITNRINPYTVIPSDWLHFFKYSYSLKGYAVVNPNRNGKLNSVFEKIFLKNKLKNFTELSDAVLWAKQLSSTTCNNDSSAA